MASAQGSGVLLGAGSASPVTELYELVSGDIKASDEHVRSNGMTGTRAHSIYRTRQGLLRVAGSITMHLNADEFSAWAPRFMGAGGVFAETLDSFYATLDKVAKVYTYSGLVIGKATFSGQAGGPLVAAFDVEGIDRTEANAGTFPSLTLSQVPHFMFHDCVISVGGSEYKFRRWQLTIDHVLDTERFLNSRTRISIPAKDRIVSVELDSPFGDNTAIRELGVTGAEVIATFTNGSDEVEFSCVNVQFPLSEAELNGKEEIFQPLRGQAGSTTSTAELVVNITT